MEEGCSYWRTETEIFKDENESQKRVDELNKKVIERDQKIKLANTFFDSIKRKRHLQDGKYDVSDIEFFPIKDRADQLEEIKTFVEKYPDFVIASAYETETEILLSKKPDGLKGDCFGSGFNYGSTNIITDCPKSILILAQND